MNSVNHPAPMMMGLLLKQVSRTLAADGLRASHLRLLAEVAATGTRISDLSDRLGMTKQACGEFVRHLAGTGHIRVVVPPDDRRSRMVVRTRLGDGAVETFVDRMGDIEADWAGRVGPRRYATFRAVLTELSPPHP